MGTSGSSGGPGSNTSLVPTWLDGDSDSFPGGDGAGQPGDGLADGDGDGSSPNPAPATQPQIAPPIQPPPAPARYQGARRNFSSFARSGGNDQRALRRAVGDYVRSGTRGSANATQRMGSSRAAARGLLGVLRDIQRDGVEATLRRLNLASLVGRPAEDVFLGLTEVICRDGGSIDEGLARDAWLETLAELQRFGIEDLGALTEPQVREMFVAFIANTIETRLFQEIGAKGLKVAADNASIEAFQAQLSSYIERGVRDSFSSDLGSLGAMSDGELRAVVDTAYREAWDLFEAWGALEE